jgi:hypothetical protein
MQYVQHMYTDNGLNIYKIINNDTDYCACILVYFNKTN